MPKLSSVGCWILGVLVATAAAAQSWSQWGGPQRDFTVAASADVESWGEHGPRVLWLRDLGAGYGSVVSDGSRLFTSTRRGAEEVVVALALEDGETLWEYAYGAPTDALQWVDTSYGDAPQATPLLSDGTLVTLGFTGVVTALRAATGEVLWTHDLGREYAVAMPYFGHAASPIQVGENVVVVAGGAHAFDLKSGTLRWQNRDFDGSYASPILVSGPAGEQLVVAGAGEVVGLDPASGSLRWRHEHANQHKTFLNTPVANDAGVVFASAFFLGSIALRLGADGSVDKLWDVEDLQVSQSNAVRYGEMIVASHNRNLVAIDLLSGTTLWRQKGVGRSNLIRWGDKTLLLDEKGRLTLATIDRQGLRRHGSADILEGRTWTAPTIVGSRLIARHQRQVVAVDLLASARGPQETLAGLSGRSPNDSALRAPAAFVQAVAALQEAALREDRTLLTAADTTFEPWLDDPRLGAYAHYYRGFAAWRMSYLDEANDRVAWVDRGVEALKASLEADRSFVESHGLLSTLYTSYYRLDRRRAGVVGPLGDEHLAMALGRDGDNPRVLAFAGMDWLKSPPQYGGDPVKGMKTLERAIELGDAEGRPAEHPGPTWGRAWVRFWMAQHLARGDAEQRLGARRHLAEALDWAPQFAAAQRLLATLPEDASASGE